MDPISGLYISPGASLVLKTPKSFQVMSCQYASKCYHLDSRLSSNFEDDIIYRYLQISVVHGWSGFWGSRKCCQVLQPCRYFLYHSQQAKELRLGNSTYLSITIVTTGRLQRATGSEEIACIRQEFCIGWVKT